MYWRQQPGLWAYFPDDAWENRTGERRGAAFGTEIGEPREVLSPSIEINFPHEFASRHLTGRVIVDPNGLLYLAHKGELKGGRANVGLAHFERLISGFCKEEVIWPGRSAGESVFVIGAIDDASFLERLSDYVKEAERLRVLARSGTLEAALRGASLRFRAGSSGTIRVRGSEGHEVNRFHEKVLIALHTALLSNALNALNSRHANMFPDIYTFSAGSLDLLFEIKTDSSFYSLYTAIGQLTVYGAGQRRSPRRVLVCPASPQHPNFKAALKQQDIHLLLYRVDEAENISFPNLPALLARHVGP